MKVATKEHGVITIITAAKQTLFQGGSQMYEPNHMVESGNNLIELDEMPCCTATYPNYPGSERTKGPGQVLARYQLSFPASSCKDPEGLEESICLHRASAWLQPAWSYAKEWDWHSQDISNTRKSSLILFPSLLLGFHASVLSFLVQNSLYTQGKGGWSVNLSKDLSTWRSYTMKSTINDQPAFLTVRFVCCAMLW